jgi:glycosyltransferase involved in cell wall biosynthesis
MRLLFVTPYLPSPARFGGQRRLEGLMRGLAAKHELSVLSFNATDPYTEQSLTATRSYCKEVITFPDMEFTDSKKKRLLQAASLFSPYSYEHLLLARRREFLARLQQLVDSNAFDIVQVEFAQMAAFRFERAPNRRYRCVLDEHNIEFDIVRRTAAAGGSAARRAYSALDWRKLRREERGAWRRFDGVSVTSRRDAAELQKLEPTTALSVVPNGVDVEQFKQSPPPQEAATLLFFGAMNYYPNQDGINYFVEQVWPKVLARRPSTKLQVMGPGSDTLHGLRGPNIELTGFVDQVEPYIDRATAVIVPLRLGGGTRLKIVEAMSKGKAIVATRVGAEGIDVVHDRHALLADTPQAFADEIERVLDDAQLRDRLGTAARQLAVDSYSWPALVSGLEAFYDELLSKPPV